MSDSRTRWAIYVRISDDPNGTGLGVGRQEQDGRAAVERVGGSVAGVYRDNDVSAYKRGVVRPEWQRLFGDLRSGRLDGLWVWDLDRLARRVRDLEDLLDIYEDNPQLRFMAAQGSIDLATDAGRTFARVIVAFKRG